MRSERLPPESLHLAVESKNTTEGNSIVLWEEIPGERFDDLVSVVMVGEYLLRVGSENLCVKKVIEELI